MTSIDKTSSSLESSSRIHPLQKLFEQVADRISGKTNNNVDEEENDSTSASAAASAAVAVEVGADTKLRLYGLYKHCTVGRPNVEECSTFTVNPTKLAKRRAWQACQAMERDQAMLEYVELAAALDSKCQQLWDEYQNQIKAKTKTNTTVTTDTTTTDTFTDGIHSVSAASNSRSNIDGKPCEEANNDGDMASTDLKPSQQNSFPNEMIWNAISSLFGVLLQFWNLIAAAINIQPVVPRGDVDIGWTDLWFAIRACFVALCTSTTAWVRQQEEQVHASIVDLWQQQAMANIQINNDNDQTMKMPPPEVVVGYTVRSLLDLYLTQKGYPPQDQKEVLMVPPINIPGMVQILRHHGLKVVAVDSKSTQIDVDKIRSAISNKTVAIMVVHPFGTTSATEQDFAKLRQLANEHHNNKLEIWEDSAECYQGLGVVGSQGQGQSSSRNASVGSHHADITFISFGIIKTATACGGGIALVRNHNNSSAAAAASMRRLQNHHYKAQTIREYFQSKLLQAVMVKVFAQSPILYGWFSQCCLWWGGYAFLDSVVTRNVRSVTSVESTNDSDVTWLQNIRKRPSLPLLQLLHRRMLQSKLTECTVSRRIEQCQAMTQLLQEHTPSVQVQFTRKEDQSLSTYWLFPIQINRGIKTEVQQALLKGGWDVAAGTSQLRWIEGAPPLVRDFMEDTLYLPVSSRTLTRTQCIDLAKKLQKAIDDTSVVDDGNDEMSYIKETGSVNRIPRVAAWLPVVLLLFVFSGNYRSFFGLLLLRICPQLLIFAFYGLVLMYFVAYGLQWLGGSIYLDSSTALVQYSSMIDTMGIETSASEESSVATTGSEDKSQPNADTISCMAALRLPTSSAEHDPTDFRGCAILTGATGFIGSLLLRDLLLHRHALNLTFGVFVLCRPKKNRRAKERISNLLKQEMFSFLSAIEKEELIHTIEGDVTRPNAGLSDSDWNQLISLPERNVFVKRVIHAAASVSFTQTLADAGKANITSALNMQALTGCLGAEMKATEEYMDLPRPKYIHLSTAFVHGLHSGSKENPLPESLFSLEPYRAPKLYESMLGTQYYASKAMRDLRFHNTYAFSKCVCEHLLLQQQQKHDIPTVIVRPSIVGPALSNPHEGWAGQKPTTIVAAGCLYLSYQWNLWCLCPKYDVTCIPVDVVSRFVLAKAFWNSETDRDTNVADATSSDGSYEKVNVESLSTTSRRSSRSPSSSVSDDCCRDTCDGEIYTAAWDTSSPDTAMFTWHDFIGATIQLGAVMGYFNRASAYIGAWVASRLLPPLQLSLESYERLHVVLVRVPLQAFLALCRALGWTKLSQSLTRLNGFLDLPLLFFPYMNEQFHFDSELIAPSCMNGQRYAFSCLIAAHRFVSSSASLKGGKTKDIPPRMSCYVIGGTKDGTKSSLWWAMTQPKGNVMVRIAGWVFAKILGATCNTVSVDLVSFRASIRAAVVAAAEETDTHLILAPTHRSFFDFILLSYLCFTIPELHICLPVIAAAEEFKHLPLIGCLAQYLGALYLRRGRGVADPDLKAKIESVKQHGPCVFEVFLEGTRSRDRRLRTPKTGFLRSLMDTGGSHIVVPIAISYERLPEQDIFVTEAAEDGNRAELSLSGLFRWLKSVVLGKVYLGNIHIAAGKPLMLDCRSSSEYLHLADDIQQEQKRITYVSNYHIEATARLLQVNPATVRASMAHLGCKCWPKQGSSLPTLPWYTADGMSELCTIMLQFSPQLAKLTQDPNWRHWLDGSPLVPGIKCLSEDLSAVSVSRALQSILSAADRRVEKAKTKLSNRGFDRPTMKHLLQTALAEEGGIALPCIILQAAASFHASHKYDHEERNISDRVFLSAEESQLQVLSDSEEALGFWGFHDSSFVLQADKKGSRYVTMQGDRYALSGKFLSKLLPFVEAETNVRIDPFNEAFRKSGTLFRKSEMPLGHSLSQKALEHLQSTVSRVSLAVSDRVRHNFGHCQEDIYAVRTGSNVRIPDAVVWPTSETEVTGLVSLAKSQSLCLIPFGGGTNVTQATRCPPKEIEPRPILSVDMGMMNKLLWLNEEDGVACIEAGVTGRALVSVLAERGYTMGHEPDSIEFSTLGGWIATKASGMKQNKYGNIEDIVKDVRVAGPNGLVWQEGEGSHQSSRPIFGRQSTGLDFRSLLMGSEGCLGIITSAVVKVWPLPEAKEYDSVLLANFELGLRFVRDVAKLGRLIPASVRLLDNEHFRLGQALQSDAQSIRERTLKMLQSLASSWTGDTLDSRSVVCTTICYEGSRQDVLQQKAAILRLAKQYGGIQLGANVGKSGYDLTFMIAYLRDFAMTYHFLGESFETFAPWSKVENVIELTKERIKREHQNRCLPGRPFIGCRVTQLYHEGACLYFYFCMNTENVHNASHVFSEIEHAARTEILEQGGSLSHHHGIGKIRSEFLKERSSPAFQNIVADLKKSMDPDNIFASGNGLFG